MGINVLMLAQLNTEYRNFGKKKWGRQFVWQSKVGEVSDCSRWVSSRMCWRNG